MSGFDEVEFNELLGKTLTEVKVIGEKEILFKTECGKSYWMYHVQDCCEDVWIESIVGDLSDLIGAPILLSEEVVSRTPPANATIEERQEREMWTFYKLATIKGYVDIRWFGTSNGWYSESVDFIRTS